jgi:transposase-like protein
MLAQRRRRHTRRSPDSYIASSPSSRQRRKDTTMNRRNRLWAGGAAALGAGVLLAGPLRAIAQDDDDWVSDALDGLVADGTITEQQADAVDQALDEARPERGPRDGRGHHGPFGRVGPAGRGIGLEAAAEAIGIEEDALRDALRDGQTIAEVAEANGVDAQVVIDAMVAAAQERIDEAIADVDERVAELTERITELVNEGFPAHPHRATDDATEDSEPADTTTPTTEG